MPPLRNEALEKLSADYGEDDAHPMLRESIEVQKDDVMALRNDLAALGTAVELPEPLAADREFFDLELRALP